MTTVDQLKEAITVDPENWKVYLFNFVDDFRYYRDLDAIKEGIKRIDYIGRCPYTGQPVSDRFDALIAAVVEYLCKELDLFIPVWTSKIYPCEPWLVSGEESLREFAILESPSCFRMRNIFVLGNFLDRV